MTPFVTGVRRQGTVQRDGLEDETAEVSRGMRGRDTPYLGAMTRGCRWLAWGASWRGSAIAPVAAVGEQASPALSLRHWSLGETGEEGRRVQETRVAKDGSESSGPGR